MSQSTRPDIKREKKKTLYMKELAILVQALAQEEPSIADVYVSRVDLSADTGICYVYFSSFVQDGQAAFDQALEVLKLYKGSMRKELARAIHGRYVPELVFVYDEKKEKERRINELLDKVQEELGDQDEE